MVRMTVSMKTQDLEFRRGSSLGNDTVYASPQAWVRAAQGTGISAVYDDKGYPTRNDLFFAIGWLVRTSRDATRVDVAFGHRVDLWVDSSRAEDNPALNGVKREFVKALMGSELHRLIQDNGYQCDEDRLRRSDLQMQLTRTTTVFKIWLPDTVVGASPERNIETVHDSLGHSVSQVLSRFETRLNEHFQSQSDKQ
jgi:hypothetical protein